MSNFDFSFNNNAEFTFDLYENVPVGTHPARVKEFYVEKDCETSYGVNDRITIVFQLLDLEQEFEYSCSKSQKPGSKYRTLFSQFCRALGISTVNAKILKQYDFEITIDVQQFPNGQSFTKITKIELLEGGDAE